MLVTHIEISLPDAHERAARAYCRTLPQARVVLHADDGAGRTVFVPPRVARLIEAEICDLPESQPLVLKRIDALASRVCYAMLIDMLSRRDYSHHEASEKLRRAGFTQSQVDSAIGKADSHRYLDDDRFATQFIEQRKARGWGKIKIEFELRRRGIEASSLAGYPEEFFSEDDDLARAQSILENKSIPTSRPVERLARHLMNKGFSSRIAFQAARNRVNADSFDD